MCMYVCIYLKLALLLLKNKMRFLLIKKIFCSDMFIFSSNTDTHLINNMFVTNVNTSEQ